MSITEITYNSKAVRLSRQILRDIEDGHYKPGSLLPIQSDMVGRYGASRSTLRRAMAILTEEGKLQKHPKRGAVVPVATKGQVVGGANRGVSTARKVTISAAWAAMTDWPAVRIFEGMKAYADQHDLEFHGLLCEDHERLLEALENFESYPAEGVFVYPYQHERYRQVLTGLVERGVPVVACRSLWDLPISTVRSDDRMGAYQAVHYLIEKYRRPVWFIGEPREGELAGDRRLGHHAAMADAGFDNVEGHVWRVSVPDIDVRYWGSEKRWLPSYQTALRMLETIELPASVYCFNDWSARGLYKAALDRGLVVGKDLAVVGNDGLPLATMVKPSLTTVHADYDKAGYEAGRLLHGLIEGTVRPPVHICIPVELIRRESA